MVDHQANGIVVRSDKHEVGYLVLSYAFYEGCVEMRNKYIRDQDAEAGKGEAPCILISNGIL